MLRFKLYFFISYFKFGFTSSRIQEYVLDYNNQNRESELEILKAVVVSQQTKKQQQ